MQISKNFQEKLLSGYVHIMYLPNIYKKWAYVYYMHAVCVVKFEMLINIIEVI